MEFSHAKSIGRGGGIRQEAAARCCSFVQILVIDKRSFVAAASSVIAVAARYERLDVKAAIAFRGIFMLLLLPFFGFFPFPP
ncbi:hypothetical protein [Treponema saccharophilum]|uniref:hypothetical protein n=1 Tax=Treponema saccharophilum TaxID=165 RepID=UPI00386B4DAE